MGVKIDTRLEMDKAKVMNRFEHRYEAAQKWMDNEVLRTTEPYVPFRTGMLARSGPGHTQLGSGEVVYETPYARRMYYGRYNFNKSAHPQATAQWFEKSKAVNKKAWLSGVEKILKG